MPKKTQSSSDFDLDEFLEENNIEKEELLSALIDSLQEFCQENILSLKPLCDQMPESEIVKERILNFYVMSNILSRIGKLNEKEMLLTPKKSSKKKCAKKKK